MIHNGFIQEDKHGRCIRSHRHGHVFAKPSAQIMSIKVMGWSEKWWPLSTRNITQPESNYRTVFMVPAVRSSGGLMESESLFKGTENNNMWSLNQSTICYFINSFCLVSSPIASRWINVSAPMLLKWCQCRVLSRVCRHSAHCHWVSSSTANEKRSETRNQLWL